MSDKMEYDLSAKGQKMKIKNGKSQRWMVTI